MRLILSIAAGWALADLLLLFGLWLCRRRD